MSHIQFAHLLESFTAAVGEDQGHDIRVHVKTRVFLQYVIGHDEVEVLLMHFGGCISQQVLRLRREPNHYLSRPPSRRDHGKDIRRRLKP